MEAHQNQNLVRVPVSVVAAKMESKKEVWDFMTQTVGAYCPDKDTVTVWHLRDMANGNKSYVKAKDIHHLYAPQYENLTVEKMMTWASRNHAAVVRDYFPIPREYGKFSRQVRATSSISILA